MKLPPNFARVRLVGHTGHANNSIAKGWKIRIGNKATFIPCNGHTRKPGIVRARLEAFLGLDKRVRTAEEILTAKIRQGAAQKRTFKNRLAALSPEERKNLIMPWDRRRRTLNEIVNEERTLDVAFKWSRMGEYRK